MVLEIVVLLVVLTFGVAASVQAWRARHRQGPLDPRSLPGQVPGDVPGPGDAGPLP